MAEHADGQVAQGCHDGWAGAGADPAGVLGEGDVADPVQAVLAGPVSAKVVGEPSWAALLERQARLPVTSRSAASGWVCSASAVTSTPSRFSGASSPARAGTSSGAPPTWRWAST